MLAVDWLTQDDIDALDAAVALLPAPEPVEPTPERTTTTTVGRYRVERSLSSDDDRQPWLVLDPDGAVMTRWMTWRAAYTWARIEAAA